MRTVNVVDAIVNSASDYDSLEETLYLCGSATNAVRLKTSMAEADASLPPGARILGPDNVKRNA